MTEQVCTKVPLRRGPHSLLQCGINNARGVRVTCPVAVGCVGTYFLFLVTTEYICAFPVCPIPSVLEPITFFFFAGGFLFLSFSLLFSILVFILVFFYFYSYFLVLFLFWFFLVSSPDEEIWRKDLHRPNNNNLLPSSSSTFWIPPSQQPFG
jgi:hypothetical protein